MKHQSYKICYTSLQVAPNGIFRIDKYESSTASSATNEQNVREMNMNQEMVDLDKQSVSLKGKVTPILPLIYEQNGIRCLGKQVTY